MFVFVATGSSWSDYNDPSFEPVFFNANLTVMFPDLATQSEAISACNPEGGGVDDSPEDRRECYFDFLVCIIYYRTFGSKGINKIFQVDDLKVCTSVTTPAESKL